MLFPTVALADETPAPENTVVQVKAGDVVPYDGILLSLDAAAKVLNEKRFSDAECDLRVEYELKIQKENLQLQLDFKDIEITSWKDKTFHEDVKKAHRLYPQDNDSEGFFICKLKLLEEIK